ncbi:MAG: 16S rRNA (cytidine(1402)-2'-O)-methyltransferase [Thiotrichales bacterium]|nr:MAG: 16S rRNA (cytidine(1402)-2'-O)-methyltransferase [Thiotrichales bacterium]
MRSMLVEENCLYIVATPIGNLADLSPRASQVLQDVAIVAAENTQHSRKLLQYINSSAQLTSLHDHNEREKAGSLLAKIQQGNTMALISDAGTPLINDPGYIIVQLAHSMGIKVVPIPGACAAIAALSSSGITSHNFKFMGFLPAKTVARLKVLHALQNETSTLIFYETPHRIIAALEDLLAAFGPNRKICMAREITKLFETIRTDTIANLLTWIQANPEQQQGEFVLVVSGCIIDKNLSTIDSTAKKIITALQEEGLSSKQISNITAKITAINKKILYNYIIRKI